MPTVTPQPQIAFEVVDTPVRPWLVDTHAHLHFDAYAGEVERVLHGAREAGVGRMITVGVNTADSRKAAQLAATYETIWAAVGIHPHEAGEAAQGGAYLKDLATRRKVVAIGECGLDLFKSQTSLEDQESALRLQVEIALERELPLIFHVRDAFEPFWKIMRDYPEARGVVHSFTADRAEMERAIEHNFYVALNGIMTFTKDAAQLEAARLVPLDRLLLETDAPFLSPVPYRGKTNEPARIADIAEFLAQLRHEPLAALAEATTRNATTLFGLS